MLQNRLLAFQCKTFLQKYFGDGLKIEMFRNDRSMSGNEIGGSDDDGMPFDDAIMASDYEFMTSGNDFICSDYDFNGRRYAGIMSRNDFIVGRNERISGGKRHWMPGDDGGDVGFIFLISEVRFPVGENGGMGSQEDEVMGRWVMPNAQVTQSPSPMIGNGRAAKFQWLEVRRWLASNGWKFPIR